MPVEGVDAVATIYKNPVRQSSPPPLPLSPKEQRQEQERKNAKISGSLIAFCVIFAWLFFMWINSDSNRKTRDAYASVKFGMSRDEVRTLVGSPDTTQDMNSTYGSSSFWYYGNVQVCFDGDKVVSINRY
jgi:hypothetical protein